MKKILLSIALGVATIASSSATVITNPDLSLWSDDFSNGISDEWTMYSAGKTAATEVAQYFPAGADPYVALQFTDGTVCAMSNSWTIEGGAVDEWLVSPAINMTLDDALLVFNVMSYGNTGDSNYAVYVSTTGNDKEDFTGAPVYEAKLRGNAQGGIAQRTIRQVLSGYKGQTIHIAFVNTSEDQAFLGFTNINLCEYDITVTNNTASHALEPSTEALDLLVQMRTPYECYGYKAVLETSTGVTEEWTTEKKVSSGYPTTSPTFSPLTVSTPGETINYTLTITPNKDGATPTKVTGSYSLAQGYPAVCVMEEATGEYCGYCTRGIAALDYYNATYGDQFIGIAVHCGSYSTGAMEFASYDPLLNEGISAFPAAVFNRQVVSDPSAEGEVQRIVAGNSPAKIEIAQVVYNPEESEKVTVHFEPTLGYSATDPNIGVAIVVLADGLKGTNNQTWCQYNNYAGTNKATIDYQFGPGWWPYFEWICNSGSVIPASQMVFNHVACGIYNDYHGTEGALKGDFKLDQKGWGSITFDMPLQTRANGPGVQDWTKTSMVALLIDLNTGDIIGGAKMHADQYSKTDSVREVAAVSYNAYQEGSDLKVVAEEGATVSVVTADGQMIGNYTMTSNVMNISGIDYNGVLVVRMSKNNSTNVAKVLWK